MNQTTKNYYYALSVLIGQIIGVGIFGLPYLIAKAGLLSLIFFIVFIGFVQYFIHLTYANIVMLTQRYHQLPGYAEIYLGSKGKHTIFIAGLLSNYSSLLAYTIVSGIFLNQLLAPVFGGNEIIYGTLIFAIEAAIVFLGVRFLSKVELFMSALLLLAIGLISGQSFEFINFNNYIIADWKSFFLPYGAMLFALDGSIVIPIVVELVKKDKENVKKIIKMGTVIPAVITAVFALIVVGITGADTTSDSLVGVRSIVTDGVITFALVFGVLCIVTSFLGSAQSLIRVFNIDYKLNKFLAWLLALSVPYMLYLIGINNLVKVISFAGAVSGGFVAIVLIMIGQKLNAHPRKNIIFRRKLPDLLFYFLFAMFIAGIFYEIFCFLIG